VCAEALESQMTGCVSVLCLTIVTAKNKRGKKKLPIISCSKREPTEQSCHLRRWSLVIALPGKYTSGGGVETNVTEVNLGRHIYNSSWLLK